MKLLLVTARVKNDYPYDSTFYTMNVHTHYIPDRPPLVDRLRGAPVCLGLQRGECRVQVGVLLKGTVMGDQGGRC